jgi:hypothetical protein
MRYRELSRLALLVLAAACGGDSNGPSNAVIADLVGTWQIQVWEYSRATNASDRVDWVVTNGLSGTLIIDSHGLFTVAPMLPAGFGQDHGTLTLQGDSLYWDGENDEEWVRFQLSGATLTLHWPETEFVDMNLNGDPEDAWLRVVLRRT